MLNESQPAIAPIASIAKASCHLPSRTKTVHPITMLAMAIRSQMILPMSMRITFY
jgi:hypothetical protein